MKKLLSGLVILTLLLSGWYLFPLYFFYTGGRKQLEEHMLNTFPFFSLGQTMLVLMSLNLISIFILYWHILVSKNRKWYYVTSLIILHLFFIGAVWPMM